jgi:hypothetical protein
MIFTVFKCNSDLLVLVGELITEIKKKRGIEYCKLAPNKVESGW